MYRLVYTVNPGIEDISAREIEAELGGRVSYELMSGRVFHSIDKLYFPKIYMLRSINRAILYLWSGRIGRRWDDVLAIRSKLVEELEKISWYITPINTFAVTTERIGIHDFTSIDISRFIGDVVIEAVYRKTGVKPRVNLRTPEVIIHAYVRDDELVIGLSLTGSRSMHRRGYRVYDHPAALKPTLAYAMLWLSGTRDKDVIIDPMCGGGTIPIEAALIHEEAKIYCYDKDPEHIRGARYNAIAAGVINKVKFGVWDARRLHELRTSFDHIVLNPPYGIRFGDPYTIRRLYRDFLTSAYQALSSNSKLTMITTEYSFAFRFAEKIGFRIVESRTVKHGGLYPKIIVFVKD